MTRLITHNNSTDLPAHFTTEGVSDDVEVKFEGIDSRKYAGESNYDQYDALVVKGTTAYLRFRFHFTGTPTGSLRLGTLQTEGGTATALTIRLSTARKLRMFTAGGSGIGSESAALAEGAWHDVEIEIPIATSGNSKLTLKLNEVTLVNAVEAAIPNEGIERWRLGNTATGAKVTTLNFDTVALNDSTGPVNNSFPAENLTPEPYPLLPLAPRMKHPMPVLYAPIIVNVPPGTDFFSETFPTDRDVLVFLPEGSARERGFSIFGGRRVVILGGLLDITHGVQTETVARIQGQGECVYMEGLHFIGGGATIDLFDFGSTLPLQPEVIVQNCLFEDVTGVFADKVHADGAQTQGAAGNIRFYKVTMLCGYQDAFLSGFAIEGIEFDTVNTGPRRVEEEAGEHDEENGYQVWFQDETPVKLTNVYADPGTTGRTFLHDLYRPYSGLTDKEGNAIGMESDDGELTGHWPKRTGIEGFVTKGRPPGGDFVTPDEVGLGYNPQTPRGGTYGEGTYGSGTYGKPTSRRITVQGRPPMRQHVLVTTPGGRTYRWAEDEPRAEQVLEDLQDSDSVPGGHKEASASLSRKAGVDYSDIQRGSRLEVFGAGGHRISEYRLERAPRSTGEKLIIEPAAVGYQGHLTDDESVQCIPVDQDMSAWGSPSSRQIAEWTAAKINQNASVELLPAGDPLGSGHPAISHKWGQINSSVANPDVAISTYDSGGVELGELLVGQFVNVKGGSGGSWVTQVSSMADDTGTGATSLHDYNATTAAAATYSIAAEQFYIRLLSGYFGTRSEQGNWEQQYRGLVVQDRSGIPLQGSWPAVGVLASDVIAYVLQKWAPLINFTTGQFGSLRATSYPIPQLAFKERTTVQDVIAQALRYELLEWGVWGSASGPQFFLNGRGEREGRKRWRARIRPSKLEESGPQLDKVINGCLVSYQDPDGSTRWVGPPGSGCRIESERLLDQDPLNPVNQIGGLKRWARKSLKGIGSPEAAIEAGEREILKSKELDGSGKATLTGFVEDEHGVEWPYYYVQAGDLIEFLDSSIKGARYIIDADRSRSSRSVAIELDSPPDTTEAVIERDNAALVELGLAA